MVFFVESNSISSTISKVAVGRILFFVPVIGTFSRLYLQLSVKALALLSLSSKYTPSIRFPRSLWKVFPNQLMLLRLSSSCPAFLAPWFFSLGCCQFWTEKFRVLLSLFFIPPNNCFLNFLSFVKTCVILIFVLQPWNFYLSFHSFFETVEPKLLTPSKALDIVVTDLLKLSVRV